jgi:hypothetical protein
MAPEKGNNKTQEQYESALDRLHARCREKKISIAGLARQIGCSRPVIYFALEKPHRYSTVTEKIEEALK